MNGANGGRPWRWRRCYRCRRVEAASFFAAVELRRDPWSEGGVLRVCPHCGVRGRTRDFYVVRERHPLEVEP